MNGGAIGGGDLLYNPATGAGQKGVMAWAWVKEGGNPHVHKLVDVPGVNNIGILIKAWGRVLAVDGGSFYLDDGFGYDHGDPNVPGVRVVLPDGVTPPSVNSYVSVTGISSCYNSGGVCYHMIRATACDKVQ